jgi:hypothetical protein
MADRSIKRTLIFLYVTAIALLVALFFVDIALGQEVALVTPAPDPLSVPTVDELTPAMLAAIVASVISLVFRFVPRARSWFDTLSGEGKQAFMLSVTFLTGCAIGTYNMAQTGYSSHALFVLLATIFAAASANQVTYQYIKIKRGSDEVV